MRVQYKGVDCIHLIQQIDSGKTPDTTLKETMLLNKINGEIISIKDLIHKRLSFKWIGVLSRTPLKNTHISFLKNNLKVDKQGYKRINLFKFRRDKYFSHNEEFSFEINFDNDVYLPIKIIGLATSAYDVNFINNTWQLTFEEAAQMVTITTADGETSMSVMDFIIEKFKRENSTLTNSVLVSVGINEIIEQGSNKGDTNDKF